MAQDEYRRKEIEFKIERLKYAIAELFQIWNMADRKLSNLKTQLEVLQLKLTDLNQGQLEFDRDF